MDICGSANLPVYSSGIHRGFTSLSQPLRMPKTCVGSVEVGRKGGQRKLSMRVADDDE